MKNRPRLTYANVVSTAALFLALSGGGAFAASQIQSGDLAPGAVRTSKVYKRAITTGKLALGAVRSNQIADGAIRSQQIGQATVAPANLEFPVFYVASPRGGSAPVTSGPDPYPISESSWTQNPGQIEVLFGGAAVTIAYDESSNQGLCRVFFEVNLNGQQVGGGEISTGSTTPQQLEQGIGAQPQIDPVVPLTNHLSVRTASNGGCTASSSVDSARFRVLDFG